MATFEWTRRKIGIIVLISFLAVFITISFIPESWFIGAPSITYVASFTTDDKMYADFPAVHFESTTTFTAIGSFSVNNPIHVKVVLKNVNLTNFLSYYNVISFLKGYSVSITFNPDGTILNAIITLRDAGNGTYVGEGDVIWLVEGPTYMIEIPNSPLTFQFYVPRAMNENPIITISGVSDTVSTHFSEATAKLAWQVGSFSIIVLEPVFEGDSFEGREIKTAPMISESKLAIADNKIVVFLTFHS